MCLLNFLCCSKNGDNDNDNEETANEETALLDGNGEGNCVPAVLPVSIAETSMVDDDDDDGDDDDGVRRQLKYNPIPDCDDDATFVVSESASAEKENNSNININRKDPPPASTPSSPLPPKKIATLPSGGGMTTPASNCTHRQTRSQSRSGSESNNHSHYKLDNQGRKHAQKVAYSDNKCTIKRANMSWKAITEENSSSSSNNNNNTNNSSNNNDNEDKDEDEDADLDKKTAAKPAAKKLSNCKEKIPRRKLVLS
jgi:hypothetical protein